METKYKGFNIEFDERTENWEARKQGDSEDMFSDKSIKVLKEKIDQHFKKDVPRLKFYDNENYSGYEIWELTSFGDSAAWASKGRNRQKLYSSHNLILVNPENDAKIVKINALIKEIKSKESQLDKLKDSLKSITVQKYIDSVSDIKPSIRL